MSDVWTAVDDYVEGLFEPPDAALDEALRASDAAGLPSIQVTATQGRFLQILARAVGARRILEVGTLGGYSTIWLARALPPAGQLTTLEISATHAEVARQNLERAGVADVVDVRVGPALETLPQLDGPFDFAFIDADKVNTAEYFAWAVRLSRPGSVIVVDNVVREGALADAATDDANVQAMRRFLEAAAKEPRVSMTVMQTVGQKKYDGFAIALCTTQP
ncbi:MAG TPA: O-methyltransferase [Thermoanaerobaculia bacterium]|nr:O-methyltransferase [Thermoanaerobaculia bacterium]